jgi:flagellar biosynthesis protein FliQ
MVSNCEVINDEFRVTHMTEAYVLTLAQNAVMVMLTIAAPILLVSLLVGSLISLVQAATQINEVTLTFIPKMIAIGLVLALLGSWMLQNLVAFTTNLFNSLPNFVH